MVGVSLDGDAGTVVEVEASGSVVGVVVVVEGRASARAPCQSVPVTSSMAVVPGAATSVAPPASQRPTRSAAAS